MLASADQTRVKLGLDSHWVRNNAVGLRVREGLSVQYYFQGRTEDFFARGGERAEGHN